MKPLPAPDVPGKSEFDRCDDTVCQVPTVSKQELLRREARAQRKEAAELRELAVQMRNKRRAKE
jgi:hypothetical protein